MAAAFCSTEETYYCKSCATAVETVPERFFAWDYYFRYRSPWAGRWEPALDRLEFEQRHPLQRSSGRDAMTSAISAERFLSRTSPSVERNSAHRVDESAIRVTWDENAARWDRGFDADGDAHRKYHSDEALLELVGAVSGQRVLDIGCGNGYLCRILSSRGASVVGVDISQGMIAIGRHHDEQNPLGISYLCASATDLTGLEDSSFDAIVANYVLSNIPDYSRALSEMHRVVRSDGRIVIAISHPCFSCGPRTWTMPAPDSPRLEEATAFGVDAYFASGSQLCHDWDGFDSIPYLHRPLRDYWHAFKLAGFAVDDFEEPSATPRGRAELPAWEVRQSERIARSCLFRLTVRDESRDVGRAARIEADERTIRERARSAYRGEDVPIALGTRG